MGLRPSTGSDSHADGSGNPVAAPRSDSFGWSDPWAYWVDAAQRSILFWDTLRKRGNQVVEFARKGEPPSMAFDYEVVMDARAFRRPVNYLLLRVMPPAGVTIDSTKRPYVIIEARSGARPGLAASKAASEVGVALRAGHPVYLVSFHPEPETGQTMEDIGHAQARFVEQVRKLHPEAEGKPVLIGNSQGGWGVMMLAAAAPDLVGVVGIAGTPLSYWAGVEGSPSMRYLAGLVGGSWPISLLGDLGNGKFDGAHLVQNFENANPAYWLWARHYDLYANVDTETPSYLRRERWRGDYFKMTKEEMRQVVDELFVGNKLTRGTILTSDRRRIDLRRIKAPIVVVASRGDGVTPPQQALYWIADLYANDQEIVAHEQTIIYTLDEQVDHVGIFVSGKVAHRQHAEIANALDIIDVLPPGLYEMILDHKRPAEPGEDLLPGEYVVRFESRSIVDILALGDGREHEKAFETVNQISEMNEGIYERFVSPWIRMWSNEGTAAFWHMAQPRRFEHFFFSDLNPAMWPIKAMAEAVQQARRPIAADHPMAQMERAAAASITDALQAGAEIRDRLQELAFKAIYNSPWVETWAGLGAPHADKRKPHARDPVFEELFQRKIEAIAARAEQGGFEEAVVRMLLAAARAAGMIGVYHFRLGQRIIKECPDFHVGGPQAFKALMREQALLICHDEEHALASLPKLLPTKRHRREALDLVKRVAMARGDGSDLRSEVLERIERSLGLHEAAEPPARRPVQRPAAAAAWQRGTS
jgi:pimeloyl-ACP methyl ester carboxylesterase